MSGGLYICMFEGCLNKWGFLPSKNTLRSHLTISHSSQFDILTHRKKVMMIREFKLFIDKQHKDLM